MAELADRICNFAGGLVCHQLPERSISINGKPLAVCARCTGIYLTVSVMFIAYVLVWMLFKTVINTIRKKTKTHYSIVPTSWQIVLAGIFAVQLLGIMIADGVGNSVGLWASSEGIRLLTGTSFGLGLYIFFIFIKNYDLNYIKMTVSKNSVISFMLGTAVILLLNFLIIKKNIGLLNAGLMLNLMIITGIFILALGFAILLFVKVKQISRWGKNDGRA